MLADGATEPWVATSGAGPGSAAVADRRESAYLQFLVAVVNANANAHAHAHLQHPHAHDDDSDDGAGHPSRPNSIPRPPARTERGYNNKRLHHAIDGHRQLANTF